MKHLFCSLGKIPWQINFSVFDKYFLKFRLHKNVGLWKNSFLVHLLGNFTIMKLYFSPWEIYYKNPLHSSFWFLTNISKKFRFIKSVGTWKIFFFCPLKFFFEKYRITSFILLKEKILETSILALLKIQYKDLSGPWDLSLKIFFKKLQLWRLGPWKILFIMSTIMTYVVLGKNI